MVINDGFKATLYYSVGNHTYRPDQLSFPSANKNVWKQFANPNKEVHAIVVVKDSEPEPPNLLYTKY